MRMPKDEFARHYGPLGAQPPPPTGRLEYSDLVVQLEQRGLLPRKGASWTEGRSKLFLRLEVGLQLDAALALVRESAARKMQTWARRRSALVRTLSEGSSAPSLLGPTRFAGG